VPLVVALPEAGAVAGDGCIAHPARAIVARIDDESRNCILRDAAAERWEGRVGGTTSDEKGG
jgi:hypothetical protein